MAVVYERVEWEDLPSTATPLNSENLNTMDSAIASVVELANILEESLNEIGLPMTEEQLAAILES